MKVRAVAHSLEDLCKAWNATHDKKVRPAGKARADRSRKCPACGGAMNKVAGNVWVCRTTILEDKKYKDKAGEEHEVQVFGPCGHRIIDNPFGG